MKLKTKIMWISSVAIFIALLISDVIIFTLVRKSYMEEAGAKATNEYQKVVNSLYQTNASENDVPTNNYIEFKLKQMNDDYNLAFEYATDSEDKILWSKEIYNHTIFEFDDLYNLNYEYVNSEYMSTYYRYSGRQYIIFKSVNNTFDIAVFRIVDITYVWDELSLIVLGMLAIMIGIILLVVIIVSMIMNRVLKPLEELNETAEKIADGEYFHRIDISSNDEIGQLSENFNKMAEAVEIRTKSLQESERKKTLFMGDLTHELKTPMTAISGYSQLLLTTKLSEEHKEEALLYIYEECGRLERLAKKMMKLLELDYEEALDLEEISAEKLFDSVSRSCSQLLKNKKMTLECIQDGEVFMVDVDLMTDALINLVDNGIKASADGSKIVLKAEPKMISVIDYGKGIPKEEQDKILEPFYMIDKSRSRQSGGAGLGLALTATIINKHNCKLVIDSEVGKGTSMILQFV